MRDHSDEDRTASLMTPARLAQLKMRPAPAASPDAWLNQMASDAGSGHVRRLLDLRKQVEAQLREPDVRGVAGACEALHEHLENLDLSQLEPKGLLARVTGKGKEAAAGFAARYERTTHAGDDLADEGRDLQRKQQAQGAATDRVLLEFDVEIRAIEKIMEQGARWLQDMRNQLKTRTAAGGDEAAQAQIRQDNERCELLVERLKLLRAANSAAQDASERCRNVAKRRAALVESLQRLLETDLKGATQKLDAVAEQAAATGAAAEGLDAARRARKELQSALQQVGHDCASLKTQEQAATDMLAGLQVSLQAAA
jgi:hypothetical protein